MNSDSPLGFGDVCNGSVKSTARAAPAIYQVIAVYTYGVFSRFVATSAEAPQGSHVTLVSKWVWFKEHTVVDDADFGMRLCGNGGMVRGC